MVNFGQCNHPLVALPCRRVVTADAFLGLWRYGLYVEYPHRVATFKERRASSACGSALQRQFVILRMTRLVCGSGRFGRWPDAGGTSVTSAVAARSGQQLEQSGEQPADLVSCEQAPHQQRHPTPRLHPGEPAARPQHQLIGAASRPSLRGGKRPRTVFCYSRTFRESDGGRLTPRPHSVQSRTVA